MFVDEQTAEKGVPRPESVYLHEKLSQKLACGSR